MADQDVIFQTVDPSDQTTDLGDTQYDTLPGCNDADTLSVNHNISRDIASGIKSDTQLNPLVSGAPVASVAPRSTLICFAYDTHIMTDRGDRSVQSLEIGDKVITRDHGMQVIRWVGSRKVAASGDTAPIVFKKGTIKNTRNCPACLNVLVAGLNYSSEAQLCNQLF